jgi:hypothetical protein
MEQLSYHCMEFHENFSKNFVQKIQILFTSDTNNGDLLNSSQNEKLSRQELYRKSQHTFHIQKLLSENGFVYGTIWGKYGTGRRGTDDNVRRM